MNDADSKKLEEIEARAQATVFTTDVDKDHLSHGDILYFISKIKEQDREIERLRGKCAGLSGSECGLMARVAELEQALLWAAEACEKAENLLAEKEKV